MHNYFQDGADYQAQAVLVYLNGWDNIEESWDDNTKCYKAKLKVARWENCREQGYIVSLRSERGSKQLNIAFFEHRNSDAICAVMWEQTSMNSITIDTAEFGDIYKDKYDTSFSVDYGEVTKMADWIYNQLTTFWCKTEDKQK